MDGAILINDQQQIMIVLLDPGSSWAHFSSYVTKLGQF